MIITTILIIYLLVAIAVFYVGSILPGMGFGRLPWKLQVQIAVIAIFWPIWLTFLMIKRPPQYTICEGENGPIAKSTDKVEE